MPLTHHPGRWAFLVGTHLDMGLGWPFCWVCKDVKAEPKPWGVCADSARGTVRSTSLCPPCVSVMVCRVPTSPTTEGSLQEPGGALTILGDMPCPSVCPALPVDYHVDSCQLAVGQGLVALTGRWVGSSSLQNCWPNGSSMWGHVLSLCPCPRASPHPHTQCPFLCPATRKGPGTLLSLVCSAVSAGKPREGLGMRGTARRGTARLGGEGARGLGLASGRPANLCDLCKMGFAL